MRAPFVKLYAHLMWATWDRRPLITPNLEPRIYGCIVAEADRMAAQVIAIGGVEDHIHVLLRYPATVSISVITKQLKGVSSHLVRQEIAPGCCFKWQGGYGAFSVADRDVESVRRYVHLQKEHHHIGRLSAILEQTRLLPTIMIGAMTP
jgi:putative transposase